MRFETRFNPWGQLYFPKKICNLGKEVHLYPQKSAVLVISNNADLGEVLHEIAILRLEIEYEKKRVDDENARQGSSSPTPDAGDYGSKHQ